MTFRYVDVCSGYSAATLAFQGFGWEAAAYAEIDPFAAAIIAHHWGGTAPMRMPDPAGPIIGLEPKDEAKERKRRLVARNSIPHYHWGDRVPNYGDFTTIQEDDVGAADLLIGGTPCQSFSQAGKRLGLDDPRGHLTLEFLALARRLRVRWLAWENVPGFLSHDGGRTAGTFFRLLGELGYGWAYRVLDAQFIRVGGTERAVPQRRRRVIVVGCLGNPAAAAAVLFDRESLRGDPRPRRRSLEDVAGTLRGSAGKRGGIQDESGGNGLVAARLVSFGEYAIDGTASTIKARDWKDATDLVMEPEVAAPLTADTDKGDQDTVILVREPVVAFNSVQDPDVSGDIAGPLNSQSPQAQTICVHADAIGRDGKAKTDSPDVEGRLRKRDAGLGISEDASFALTTGQPHAIAFQERGRPEGRAVEWQEDVAYGLLSPADGGRRSEMNICDGWRVRRLTPVECERLQGVPDHYTHIELKKRQRSEVPAELADYWLAQRPDLTAEQLQYLCANSPRYRVLGNSYARNFIRWVGWGIRIVDEAVFG